jgi:uncharacterized membrane protein
MVVLGLALLVIGLILVLLGMAGRAIDGRRHSWQRPMTLSRSQARSQPPGGSARAAESH